MFVMGSFGLNIIAPIILPGLSGKSDSSSVPDVGVDATLCMSLLNGPSWVLIVPLQLF